MLFPIAHLPNACVGALPVLANPVEAFADLSPRIICDRADVLVTEIDRVHDLAINVHLDLRNRGITDAHGAGSAIALPVFQDLLLNLDVATDARDYRKRNVLVIMLARVRLDPVDE